MATLPDASSLTYSTPEPKRALVDVPQGDGIAEGLEYAGKVIGNIADDQQKKLDTMQQSYAESQFLSGQIDAINQLRDDKDFSTAQDRYDQRMRQLAAQAGKQIQDSDARNLWVSSIQPNIARGRGQVQEYARNTRILTGQANSMQADGQDTKSYLNAPTESDRASIVNNMKRRIQMEQDTGVWNPLEAEKKRQEWIDTSGKMRADREIEAGQLPTLAGQSQGGFDASYNVVAKNEGGFTASDGATNAPAIFGINSKYHPEAFAEAKRMYDTGDVDGAKSYAKDWYKKEYWDKNNLDALPAGVQDVVLDGTVNHYPGFGQKLIDAAKTGASRSDLIDMRRGEYARLRDVKNPDGSQPYAASYDGWSSRLDRIAQGGDSYLAALSPQAYEQVRSKAQAYESVHIRKDMTDIDNAADMAVYVPPEKIESLAARADRAGLPEYGRDLRKYGAVQTAVNIFGDMGTKAQNADLSDLKQKISAGSVGLIDEFTAKSKVFAKKASMLSDGQGWEYYAMRGVIPQPSAMNLSDPKDVAAKLDMRRVDLARVQQIEGPGFNMPILTKGEIDTLDNTFKTGTPEQVSAALSSVGSSLNGQERLALARQIAPTNNLLAAALNLDRATAAQVIAGSKSTIALSQKDVNDAVDTQLGGVIADSTTYETAKDAVYAYYKTAALQENKLGDAVDSDILNKSINAVVGPILDITPRGNVANDVSSRGGFATMGAGMAGQVAQVGLPSRVFSYRKPDGTMAVPEEIEDTLGGITDAKLKAANGQLPMTTGGDTIPAPEIVKRAQWRSAGDGLYIAIYPGFGKVVNRDGTDYLFDARKLNAIAVNPKEKNYDFLDTKLSPSQEADFQKWKAKNAPKDSGFDYDLRGAYLKGLTRSKDNGHFPDEFKKPNHPTFSNQSKFAADYPKLAGSWNGDTYIPPAGQ